MADTASDRLVGRDAVGSAHAPSRRLPQLDGLRAVAVTLVIAAHSGFLVTMPPSVREWLAPVLAGDGVQLFFVLSGYLITALLLRERQRTGTMSLRRFYLRRILRIWPACYAFLAVMALLVLTGALDLRWRYLATSALFVINYVPVAVRYIGHTWSLAVEEQFYLVWPAVLSRLRAAPAATVALVVVAAAPLFRLLTWQAEPGKGTLISHMTHARADALMLGAALALWPVARPSSYQALVRLVLRARLDLLGAVYFFLLAPWWLMHQGPELATVVSRTPSGIAAGLVLLGLLERPHGRCARLLATPPLVHVGLLSYSLYLWQEPFLTPGTDLPWVVRLGGALVAAELSLWLVERPFLRWKRRFEPAA